MKPGSWPKQLAQAFDDLRNKDKQPPKEGSKEYWMQRCAMAEAAAYKGMGETVVGCDLFTLVSVNPKVDDMAEYRNLLQVDVCNTDCYNMGLSSLGRIHLPLSKFFRMLTANKTDPRANAKRYRPSEEAAARAEERYNHTRRVAIEGIIAQLQRIRSKENAPLWTVVKSIVALRNGLRKSFWEAECAQRLLMSRPWTLKFVLEMTQRGIEEPFQVAEDITLCVYDNCDYHRTKAFQRTDAEGEYIKTVTVVHVPLPQRQYSVDPTEFRKCLACCCAKPAASCAVDRHVSAGDNQGLYMLPKVSVVHRMDPNLQAVKQLCDDMFLKYLEAARANDHFQAGKYEADLGHSGRATHFEVWPPLVGYGTESYADNHVVLQRIQDKIQDRFPGNKATIIVGDQQTFDRMMKLRKYFPQDYKWVVPFAGEMHLCAHFLHAGWRLYWSKLLQWAVNAMGMTQTLKEEWAVKEWNYYDDFIFMFTTAIVRFLVHYVPRPLYSMDALLNLHADNIDFAMIIHFLYDFAIPYCELRQTIRKASTANHRQSMDLFYNMCMHMCRVEHVNKFHYAILCVQVVWLYHNVIPSVREVWDSYATISLRGNVGRNVAVDHLCEKVNLASKMIVKGHPTPSRIRLLVPCLNVCLPTEAAYLAYVKKHFDEDDDDVDESTGKANREATIAEAVTLLKRWIGDSWERITRDNDDLHLVQVSAAAQGTMPWDHVLQKSASWREYVEEKQDDIEM